MVGLAQWEQKNISIETTLTGCLFEFARAVDKLYPGRLYKAVLYGSYAKGTWQEDSDVDVALIMNRISISEVVNGILEIAVDLEYKYGFCISPIGIDSEDYNKNSFKPLYKNIRNEGIVIWEKS